MITNLTRKTRVASQVEWAKNPWQRMKGLLGKNDFPPHQALIITKCQSIHMFFMKFPIDVVFCDRNNIVVGRCEAIRPFCLSPVFFQASFAIELPSGSIASSNTRLGDHIQIDA